MFIFTQEITLLKGSPFCRSGVFMLWGWKVLFVNTELCRGGTRRYHKVLSITVQGKTGYFPVLQRKDEHTV
jgi:hypothetical protein